tara:strand:- start:3858 stop:4034 length:177 start_codon:yes stop_codon:yes gene_type:complete
MRDWIGHKQLKAQRKLKDWVKNLDEEKSRTLGIDKKTFDLGSENIIKTFGDYFKPKNK